MEDPFLQIRSHIRTLQLFIKLGKISKHGGFLQIKSEIYIYLHYSIVMTYY